MTAGRRRRGRVVLTVAAAALGLLLWTRLRLVTDTPRMVYADPASEKQPQGESSK